MEEAVPAGVGAMSAVLGMKQADLEDITQKYLKMAMRFKWRI